jgi:O-acetyl-ADP-ribose deacetylase (regulator of RNase III)
MIITHGDVLNTDCWIIAHQVNCQGVMGGGLARQIKDRYPDAYINYREYIEDYKDCNGTVPLGTILETRHGAREIWHVFGQEFYGTDKQYTDYEAVEAAFKTRIRDYRCEHHVQEAQIPIAIPLYFGCGLGGGNWSVMKSYLEQIEQNEDVWFIAYNDS